MAPIQKAHPSYNLHGSSQDSITDTFHEPLLQQRGEVSSEEEEEEEFVNQLQLEEENQHQTKTTDIQTFLHLIKGIIGPSCLSLPWAFSQLGLCMGVFVTVLLAALTTYNSLSIVLMKEQLHQSRILNILNIERRPYSLGDLSERAYGKKFRIFVIACLCAQQLAICAIFFSFIGDNLAAVALALSQNENMDTSNDYNIGYKIEKLSKSFESSYTVILVTGPIMLSFSFFPNLKTLVPISLIGTISLYLGLGLLGIVCALNWRIRPILLSLESSPALSLGPTWTNFPIAVSSILYSLERTNLVLTIQSSMKTPEHFDRVYISAMILVVLTITIFSSICFLTFGNVHNGSILAFLLMQARKENENFDIAQNINLIIAADIVYCISVLFSYPHQLFPCISILGQVRVGTFLQYKEGNSSYHDESIMNQPSASVMTIPIHNSHEDLKNIDRKYHDAFNNNEIYVSFGERPREQPYLSIPISVRSQIEGDSAIMRATLVMITFLIAIFILGDNREEWNIILFAAVFAGTITTLIVPPLIQLGLSSNHNAYNSHNNHDLNGHDHRDWEKIRCWVLILFGSLLGLVGTIASLREMYLEFHHI